MHVHLDLTCCGDRLGLSMSHVLWRAGVSRTSHACLTTKVAQPVHVCMQVACTRVQDWDLADCCCLCRSIAPHQYGFEGYTVHKNICNAEAFMQPRRLDGQHERTSCALCVIWGSAKADVVCRYLCDYMAVLHMAPTYSPTFEDSATDCHSWHRFHTKDR